MLEAHLAAIIKWLPICDTCHITHARYVDAIGLDFADGFTSYREPLLCRHTFLGFFAFFAHVCHAYEPSLNNTLLLASKITSSPPSIMLTSPGILSLALLDGSSQPVVLAMYMRADVYCWARIISADNARMRHHQCQPFLRLNT